jgi:hypothetical protein
VSPSATPTIFLNFLSADVAVEKLPRVWSNFGRHVLNDPYLIDTTPYQGIADNSSKE